MFLRNCWYVAALASEVTAALFARRLLDEPVLFYRTADGRAVAIGNRCPHRFAPLSKGRRIGDAVQCGYHGLTFGPDGACHGQADTAWHVPPGTRVPSYPIVERDGLVWIWMGEAEHADPAVIPDIGFMTRAGEKAQSRYMYIRSDYRVAIDNLMDLSHAAFVHAETLGLLTPKLLDGKLDVRQEAGRITAAIAMKDVSFGTPGVTFDQWLDVEWIAPSNVLLSLGHVPAGRPRPGDGPIAMHLLTPETATTSHYFQGGVLDAEVVQPVRDPFMDEDEPMLAACQEMMGDSEFWALRPVILPWDAGGVRVRRHLERLIRAERPDVVDA